MSGKGSLRNLSSLSLNWESKNGDSFNESKGSNNDELVILKNDETTPQMEKLLSMARDEIKSFYYLFNPILYNETQEYHIDFHNDMDNYTKEISMIQEYLKMNSDGTLVPLPFYIK